MAEPLTSSDTKCSSPPPESAEFDSEELIEDELLVEEVSIDGMCGVY